MLSQIAQCTVIVLPIIIVYAQSENDTASTTEPVIEEQATAPEEAPYVFPAII